MVKRKARTVKDFLPDFGGFRFPMQIATTSDTQANGSSQTFCGIRIRPTENHCQPVAVLQAKQPPAMNPETTVAYCKLETPTAHCSFCSARMWIEEKVHKSNKTSPRFSLCCQEGKVQLPLLHPPPEPLKTLLAENSSASENFRRKIRIYNSMFSFTSFGARIDEKINRSRGPYAFRISGQNYHHIGSLLPDSGNAPRYAQLYFCNPETEVQNRMGCMNLTNDDIDPIIVRQLINMLDNNSAVAKAFRMARDWCHDNLIVDFRIKLIGQRTLAQRQYRWRMSEELGKMIMNEKTIMPL